ncbi:MAG: hypothetical protein ACR2GP_10300 [Burkholderiaceae bacterium]
MRHRVFDPALVHRAPQRRQAVVGGERSGRRIQEQLSVVLYAGGIVCAFFFRYVSLVFFVIVASIWLIPDRRIERAAAQQANEEG